nr:hypothetical protein [Paenibacillus periandrae]
MILLLFLGLFSTHFTLRSLANEIPPMAEKVLQEFAQNNGQLTEVSWNNETQTPALLRGQFTQPSHHSLIWIAYESINRLKSLYGLSNAQRDLKVIEIGDSTLNNRFVRFQHMLFKTPVWGDELVVEIDHKGIAHKIYGTIHPKLNQKLFNRPMIAAVSENQAIRIALGSLAESLSSISHTEATKYYLPTRKGIPLVYVIKIQFNDPELKEQTILVHALTGNVVPASNSHTLLLSSGKL